MGNKAVSHRQKPDLYQSVTNRIIAALEAGTIPWKKTWRGGVAYARNYVTGHMYQGINALLTNLSQYDVPYFMTFKQTQYMGGHIKKGAKGIPIVFWKVFYVDADRNIVSEEAAGERSDLEKKFSARYFTVFNIEDVEGISFTFLELQLADHDPIQRCEEVVSQMPNPPKIEHVQGNRIYYSPLKDKVCTPVIGQYVSPEAYYNDYFHELAHATGHASRLNRAELMTSSEFGSDPYSQEEMTAEISANFLLHHCGIATPDVFENSASYIQGWLQKLRDDKRFVVSAAIKAEKAVKYILGELEPVSK